MHSLHTKNAPTKWSSTPATSSGTSKTTNATSTSLASTAGGAIGEDSVSPYPTHPVGDAPRSNGSRIVDRIRKLVGDLSSSAPPTEVTCYPDTFHDCEDENRSFRYKTQPIKYCHVCSVCGR